VKLQAANEAFKVLMKERDAEIAARTDLVVKNVRKEVIHALRELFGFVEAKIIVTGDRAPFADFIRDVNVILDRYAKQLAIHKGRLAAKKDDEEAPPPLD
jgi:hypothetical protein